MGCPVLTLSEFAVNALCCHCGCLAFLWHRRCGLYHTKKVWGFDWQQMWPPAYALALQRTCVLTLHFPFPP